MTADIAHHAVSVGLGKFVDGAPHVAEEAPRSDLFQPYRQTLLCDFHQPLLFGRNLPDAEHTGRIRKIAVELGRAVHIDDVALLQHPVGRGNAVAHHVVNGGAVAFGIAFIIQRRGQSAALDGLLIDPLVDFLGGDAGLDVCRHIVQNGDVDLRALPDTGNLGGGFDHAAGGDFRAHVAVTADKTVKIQVAFFVFDAAAAPAGVVASDFTHSFGQAPFNNGYHCSILFWLLQLSFSVFWQIRENLLKSCLPGTIFLYVMSRCSFVYGFLLLQFCNTSAVFLYYN